MNKRLYFPVAILAILAVGLTACNNPRAESAGVWYNPFSWGDQTLAASLAKECDGLPAGSSAPINGAQVPCPGTEAAPAGTFQGEVAAYAVTTANGWPVDFGENRTMTVQAPENQDLVVNYGREGFAADGTQVQVCGTALVPAGSKLDLVFWAGNAEAVTKGYGLEYANFTYNNRSDPVNGDSKGQAWEQVMAATP